MLQAGSVARWTRQLDAVHARLAPHFVRPEPRRRARAYLQTVLAGAGRRNGWQLAEAAGEPTPYGMQRLLTEASWDANAVRDDLRAYVTEHLGCRDAVLVIDETGFLKQGTKSAGVQRQYSGTAGRIENCQIGVFLAYASSKGAAFLDRALYLPEAWCADRERCREAHIPDAVTFATKPELARRMLERALAAAVPARWVTGDTIYGQDRRLRLWLESVEQPFVLAVPSHERPMVDAGRGPQHMRVDELARRIPPGAWRRLSAGAGSKGERISGWARAPLFRLWPGPWEHWLLVRQSLSEAAERAYYVVFAPIGTSLADLVRVAGSRWQIESCFESAKQEVGLDEYEVRTYDAWYRYVTLALFAHAFLAVVRAQAAPRKKGTRAGRPVRRRSSR